MKKVSELMDRSRNVLVIACEIIIILSEAIRVGLKPVGNAFLIAYFVALVVLGIVMIARIGGNFTEMRKNRLQFLVANIVSFVVLVIMTIGLLFNYYENANSAVIVNYVALVLFMFSSLCLL